MKQFGKAMLQCKPFSNRQKCLTNSLDYFSIDYPELYSELFVEIKNRGKEYNDLNKISRWQNTSTTNNYYAKLHEALISVKKGNIIAQEQYIIYIQHLLYQTIEKKTNIKEAVKICNLIKKMPNLTIIYG